MLKTNQWNFVGHYTMKHSFLSPQQFPNGLLRDIDIIHPAFWSKVSSLYYSLLLHTKTQHTCEFN